jgi:hypothetical protein
MRGGQDTKKALGSLSAQQNTAENTITCSRGIFFLLNSTCSRFDAFTLRASSNEKSTANSRRPSRTVSSLFLFNYLAMSISRAVSFPQRVQKLRTLGQEPVFSQFSWLLDRFCRSLLSVSILSYESIQNTAHIVLQYSQLLSGSPEWFQVLGTITQRLTSFKEHVNKNQADAVNAQRPVLLSLCT